MAPGTTMKLFFTMVQYENNTMEPTMVIALITVYINNDDNIIIIIITMVLEYHGTIVWYNDNIIDSNVPWYTAVFQQFVIQGTRVP